MMLRSYLKEVVEMDSSWQSQGCKCRRGCGGTENRLKICKKTECKCW